MNTLDHPCGYQLPKFNVYGKTKEIKMKKLQIHNIEIKQLDNHMYCLNDFHKASGQFNKNKPNLFMNNKQTLNLIEEIQKAGIPAFYTKQGLGGGTYVCKELVYAYAMWISPAFHLYVIRTFDEVMQKQAQAQEKQIKRHESTIKQLSTKLKSTNTALNVADREIKLMQKTRFKTNQLGNYTIRDQMDLTLFENKESNLQQFLLKAHKSGMNTYPFVSELAFLFDNICDARAIADRLFERFSENQEKYSRMRNPWHGYRSNKVQAMENVLGV